MRCSVDAVLHALDGRLVGATAAGRAAFGRPQARQLDAGLPMVGARRLQPAVEGLLVFPDGAFVPCDFGVERSHRHGRRLEACDEWCQVGRVCGRACRLVADGLPSTVPVCDPFLLSLVVQDRTPSPCVELHAMVARAGLILRNGDRVRLPCVVFVPQRQDRASFCDLVGVDRCGLPRLDGICHFCGCFVASERHVGRPICGCLQTHRRVGLRRFPEQQRVAVTQAACICHRCGDDGLQVDSRQRLQKRVAHRPTFRAVEQRAPVERRQNAPHELATVDHRKACIEVGLAADLRAVDFCGARSSPKRACDAQTLEHE
jgi:hypothetical protein